MILWSTKAKLTKRNSELWSENWTESRPSLMRTKEINTSNREQPNSRKLMKDYKEEITTKMWEISLQDIVNISLKVWMQRRKTKSRTRSKGFKIGMIGTNMRRGWKHRSSENGRNSEREIEIGSNIRLFSLITRKTQKLCKPINTEKWCETNRKRQCSHKQRSKIKRRCIQMQLQLLKLKLRNSWRILKRKSLKT